MATFLAHVGDGNSIDLDYTLGQRRTFREVVGKLPRGPERNYFESDSTFREAFPTGDFNVWGVPDGAEDPFYKTRLGDLVFFAPNVSCHDGNVMYFGIVKAIPRSKFPKTSRILWMESGPEIYPNLFFLDVEVGLIPWENFMADNGYSPNWNPRGWYVRLANPSFRGTHNQDSYLAFLRSSYGFKEIGKAGIPKPN